MRILQLGLSFVKKKDIGIEMNLLENNSQIFASKFQTVLPSKNELQKLLEDKNLEQKNCMATKWLQKF